MLNSLIHWWWCAVWEIKMIQIHNVRRRAKRLYDKCRDFISHSAHTICPTIHSVLPSSHKSHFVRAWNYKKTEAEDGKFMKNSNFIPTTGERRFSRDLFWLFFEQKKVVVRSDNETATIVAFEEFYRLFCTFWRRLGWTERGRRMWILFYFISFSRARVASPDVATPKVSICFHYSIAAHTHPHSDCHAHHSLSVEHPQRN